MADEFQEVPAEEVRDEIPSMEVSGPDKATVMGHIVVAKAALESQNPIQVAEATQALILALENAGYREDETEESPTVVRGPANELSLSGQTPSQLVERYAGLFARVADWDAETSGLTIETKSHTYPGAEPAHTKRWPLRGNGRSSTHPAEQPTLDVDAAWVNPVQTPAGNLDLHSHIVRDGRQLTYEIDGTPPGVDPNQEFDVRDPNRPIEWKFHHNEATKDTTLSIDWAGPHTAVVAELLGRDRIPVLGSGGMDPFERSAGRLNLQVIDGNVVLTLIQRDNVVDEEFYTIAGELESGMLQSERHYRNDDSEHANKQRTQNEKLLNVLRSGHMTHENYGLAKDWMLRYVFNSGENTAELRFIDTSTNVAYIEDVDPDQITAMCDALFGMAPVSTTEVNTGHPIQIMASPNERIVLSGSN